ncbi:MAG: aminodeoxychorismate/anthranilate synthase component II [Desulfobacteraceae bacterium]|nr:aminodeoxychorismate/anthranilate synthase component II [Desulfobacteraceae bacterium]
MCTLLMIDNYDSFTFNLVQMFRQYPLEVKVFRSDKVSLDDVNAIAPDYIVISPGPKDPENAGISKMLIRDRYQDTPILGVCLGMQCLNEVFGGCTIRSPEPLHGKTSDIVHSGSDLFKNLPSPFRVARYHSLAVEPDNCSPEPELTITATTADHIIMGLSHRRYPLHGVQFHPESFLTEHGFQLVENFLKLGPLEYSHEW